MAWKCPECESENTRELWDNTGLGSDIKCNDCGNIFQLSRRVNGSTKNLSQIVEVSELIKEKLQIAILLMDERGRLADGAKSTILWNNEWEELRKILFESSQLLHSISNDGI